MMFVDHFFRPAYRIRHTVRLEPLPGHRARLTIEPLPPAEICTLREMLHGALQALKDEGAPQSVSRSVSTVEPARFPGYPDGERLVFEVETNAALSPARAFVQAAHFLMAPLASFAATTDGVEAEASARSAAAAAARTQAHEQAGLHRSVDELGLPVRASNVLKAQNVVLWGDLVHRAEVELLRLPLLGRKSVEDIKAALAAHGLTLGQRVQGWPSGGDGRLH